MASKPPFVGEKVKLSFLLEDSFSGEWGKEAGDDLVPVLRTANFNEDGTFDYTMPAMRCVSANKVSRKAMRRGDIVLEKSGGTPNRPVGIMAYYDSDTLALCSNFNHVLRFNTKRSNSRYMFYQLRWLKKQNAFESYTRKTTGLQNLQMKSFVDLSLKCPDLDTQNERANTLRSIHELIQLYIASQDGFDQLVKSRFVEMFGDPTKPGRYPLATLGDLYHVRSSKRIYSHEQTKEGVPFYRLADIGSLIDGATPRQELFISNDRYAELKKNGMVPTENDVLVTARGTLGKCYVIKSTDKFYFQDGMITWLSQTAHSPLTTWLVELFANQAFLSDLSKNCSGTTVKYLSISDLSNKHIPVPPTDLQQQFVDFVIQVDKSRFVGCLLVAAAHPDIFLIS